MDDGANPAVAVTMRERARQVAHVAALRRSERDTPMRSDPPVTLKDVAALAGVHPATASRALNPETRLLVSGETAERVLAAADSLGYRPNTVARSLRTRRSHTVGVLIPDLTNPLFPPIVRGIEDRLAADGYVALIGNTDSDDERERLVFERMRARHVDGFVCATAHLSSPLLAEAASAGIPVVLVNRYAKGYGFPAVSVDNERGIGLAVSHLVSLGHRRIAHIAGPQDVSTGLLRYRGFTDAMAAHGLAVDPALVAHAAAYSLEEGDRLSPPLTSVSFPHYQVGTEAGRLMLELIAATGQHGAVPGDHAEILYLAPELRVRGSTAPPRAPDAS